MVKSVIFAVYRARYLKSETIIFSVFVSLSHMRKSLLLLFCFICSSASAQMLTVSATVVDKESREPLAFATVGIKLKPIGTIPFI